VPFIRHLPPMSRYFTFTIGSPLVRVQSDPHAESHAP
jgi:hypothetical protein